MHVRKDINRQHWFSVSDAFVAIAVTLATLVTVVIGLLVCVSARRR